MANKVKRKKYNYFYKITNNINGHFYYGVHATNSLNDGYMGSGTRLKLAYKKYGVENFTKEILKYFDTIDEAFDYEGEIVNEVLVYDNNCYNMCKGGLRRRINLIHVVDKDGNNYNVEMDDPRYLSGELKHPHTNKIIVEDKDGNRFTVDKDDPRYLSGELKPYGKDKILVYDKDQRYYMVDKNDPRYLSGELKHYSTGKITVRDKNGKQFRISKDDPRVLSGEVEQIWKNRILVWDENGKAYRVKKDDPRVLSGELTNRMKGRSRAKDKDGNIGWYTKEEIIKNNLIRVPYIHAILTQNCQVVRISSDDPRFETGEAKLPQDFKHGSRIYVRDKNNIPLYVLVNDPRLYAGELIRKTDKVWATLEGYKKPVYVKFDDPRFETGELKYIIE